MVIKKIDWETALNTIEENGDGYHEIGDGWYAFGEGWTDECVEEFCGKHHDDISKYEECAWEHAYDITHTEILEEIKDKNYDIDHIELVDMGWHPYGTTVALLREKYPE